MEIIHRYYRGKEYDYETCQGVIGHDYYKDHLVDHLHMLPTLEKDGLRVLDIATGHGYSAIILADYYKDRIASIIAYDINPRAVEMTRRNAVRHGCDQRIDLRVGTLYEPLRDEKFDLILSALPPVPVTSDQLAGASPDVRAHHWVASTAGPTGRDLLDGMICSAHEHLHEDGMIATATADFQNATKHTLEVMASNGLLGWKVGNSRPQNVSNTKLTLLAKRNILALDYKFTKDSNDEEIFFVETYAGKKMPNFIPSANS